MSNYSYYAPTISGTGNLTTTVDDEEEPISVAVHPEFGTSKEFILDINIDIEVVNDPTVYFKDKWDDSVLTVQMKVHRNRLFVSSDVFVSKLASGPAHQCQ